MKSQLALLLVEMKKIRVANPALAYQIEII
jgi:hypothetical protein